MSDPTEAAETAEVVAESIDPAENAATAMAEEAAEAPEPTADPVLLAARDQARAALAEITAPETIGADAGHEAHDAHVLTLLFECRMPGYPGWSWAATLARVDEESPVNVLEVELLPGDGSVVAPDWVPWSERLAQYREAQARQTSDEAAAAEAAAEELADVDDVEPEDDLMENDFSDYDDEIDGVDLDSESDDDLEEDSTEEGSDSEEGSESDEAPDSEESDASDED